MTGVQPGVFAAAVAAALVAGTAVFVATWLVGLRQGRHRVVDVAWGVAFTAMAGAGLAVTALAGAATPAGVLVTVLVAVWGLRLAWHIAGKTRRETGEDPRYAELLGKGAGRDPRWYALRAVYLLQAVIAWFVVWPVLAVQAAPGLPVAWLVPGVLVWAVGLFFEAVGDAQLAAFKADPARRGGVLDTGLWRYTRHPNYFGDTCVWWGFWLMAAASGTGALTVLSAVLMTYFLAGKTGKPLTERNLGARPGYADYVARTSGFFPLPPKRSAP